VASAWTVQQIAEATGAPAEAVAAHWPGILAALEAAGIGDRDVQMGVISTVAIETASTFRPIHEYKNADGSIPASWYTYDGGPTYHGRGYIQLTHRSNYRAAGQALGVDLVSTPDLALDPEVAAAVLAWYWATRGVKSKDGKRWYSLPDLCRAHDWEWVRRVVQGATAGLDRLRALATTLDAIKEISVVTYNPTTPAIAQDDGWSCAPTALRWALTALGRNPGPTYIEDLMVRDGVVSKEAGLLDATGAGLAEWIGRREPKDVYYGADGFYGNHEPVVTFDGVALEGDHAYPLLIGGRKWNHWSGVRGFDPARGVLLLANPGENWMGVGQEMDRGQFELLGPFSMVRVLHPDLPGVGPAIVVQPTADALLLAEIKAEMRAWIARLDAAGVP
jgi:hypothetical protein